METLQIILDLIVAICALVPTLVSVFCLVKNIIKSKNWDLTKVIVQDAVKAIEEYAKDHPDMTSEDKLNMALEAIKAGLAAAGIKFDEELIKQIIAYIEELCAFSKKVNVCSCG